MTTPTDPIVQAIQAQLGEEVTAEQVNNVLAALNNVQNGDPVGVVRRDPTTGAVAHRVSDFGTPLWRVSSPEGGQWNDMQPTLAWELIYEPQATAAEETQEVTNE